LPGMTVLGLYPPSSFESARAMEHGLALESGGQCETVPNHQRRGWPSAAARSPTRRRALRFLIFWARARRSWPASPRVAGLSARPSSSACLTLREIANRLGDAGITHPLEATIALEGAFTGCGALTGNSHERQRRRHDLRPYLRGPVLYDRGRDHRPWHRAFLRDDEKGASASAG